MTSNNAVYQPSGGVYGSLSLPNGAATLVSLEDSTKITASWGVFAKRADINGVVGSILRNRKRTRFNPAVAAVDKIYFGHHSDVSATNYEYLYDPAVSKQPIIIDGGQAIYAFQAGAGGIVIDVNEDTDAG